MAPKAKVPATKAAAKPAKVTNVAKPTKPGTGSALKAKKHVQKGKHLQRSRKIRTTARFRRPTTLSLPRTPRYQRKSVPHKNRYDTPHLFIKSLVNLK
jgi:hypothetical protein